MLTENEKNYYKNCVHELNRGVFFGTVPNYVDRQDAEIIRLEGLSADYSAITKSELDDYSKARPYGSHASSANKEETVTSRTGVTWRKKGVLA